ncbi:hypothetical protein DAMNIGENAA_16210 [Desulforhabdus amnigena]|uniref:Uncharacterized protein n=1 Tax=Desulforhabdus amnigena TaxID=40218 RepID=A0A9W6FSL8_9BACT|nr:hypothetical protein DAMNIGENAA_16210 [Desulforhabdus amnigena]
MACCPDGCLGPIIDTQFIENMNHVAFYRMWANVKGLGDFHIRGPFGHKAKHIKLPPGERRWKAIVSCF